MKPRDIIERALPWSVYGGRMQTADAILAALAIAGFVVVPRVPTLAMLNASAKVDDEAYCGGSAHGADDDQIWEAMVDAAEAERAG